MLPAVDVPYGDVTVTATVPVPGGALTVISVLLTMTTVLAGVVPKSTAAGATNPVPVRVTGVPPDSAPAGGASDVTVGGAT